MNTKIIFCLLTTALLSTVPCVQAQPTKVHRIGAILPGGPLYEAIDGLKAGLKELGLEEGRQFTLAVRDTKGVPKAAEEAARSFEG